MTYLEVCLFLVNLAPQLALYCYIRVNTFSSTLSTLSTDFFYFQHELNVLIHTPFTFSFKDHPTLEEVKVDLNILFCCTTHFHSL